MTDLPPVASLSEALEKKAAKLRAEIAALEASQLQIRGLSAGTSAGTSAALEAPAEAPPELEAPHWLHPADVIRSLKHSGIRFPTGIRSLDDATRGGIQRGRVVTIVGAPGAGKTGLSVQLAARIADADPAGVFVSLYLADEGIESGVIRLAQHGGSSRDLLESADPEAIAEAASHLERRGNLLCYNGERDDASLSAFLTESTKQAAGRLEVWIIDSAQVIAPGSAGPAKDRRLTVAEIAETVRKRTRTRGAVTFLLSQSNRASWRHKKAEDNADPLSAGAESSALEFNADVLLFMSSAGEDVSSVVIPKNRLGPRVLKPFSLSWHRPSATFAEPMLESLDQTEDAITKQKKAVREWAHRVSIACQQNPDGLSGEQVKELAALSGTQWKAVRENLEAHHLLRHVTRPGKGGGVLWFAVDAGYKHE